jgi:superfamily II DNA/RNA helicase
MPEPTTPSLGERVPSGGETAADEILDLFVGWVADQGIELYDAQEEAILELLASRHVVLNTPTGSGKSMVALALHFKALCEGKRCYYTSPIKALASEKFFALCNDLGAENVGMQTGDASINATAPIVCCTAEVLANLALRRGHDLEAPYVVMDEFHYYADPDRGVAWQTPLLTLPDTQFLLMSATLGNTASIEEHLQADTGRAVARVASLERPVPLDYEYRETPLPETIDDLMRAQKIPIYIVNFTQRDCAELAQSLTSLQLTDREEKRELRRVIGDFRFDTPYGRELKRFLRFGIGVHHAGLLPKYRLLVEQLSQRGQLKVICGTDTLGVGVNIPIRTVLFTKLCKFDGKETIILKVRDFKQISGRAGRKGFDDNGSVVCQAPEHVIENLKRERKAAGDPRKMRKLRKKGPPERRFLEWNEKTFQSLIHRPPETLESRFWITHSTVLSTLQRDADENDPSTDNFASLRLLIDRSHEQPERKRELVTEAAQRVFSLYRAGILKLEGDAKTNYRWVSVAKDLQFNFSMHQSLSLFLIETLELLDPQDEEHTLDVVSLVESILENPWALLYRQIDKARDLLRAELKAEGLSWEERKEPLNRVTYPKPLGDEIERTFEAFRQAHPWVGAELIRPKSIAREIWESYVSFNDYVRLYGLHRSEGLLLRYLSQLYKTLNQSVPERHKTEEIYDLEAFFRTLIEHTDSSLLAEWEALVHPEIDLQTERDAAVARRALRSDTLLHDPKAFAARVRAEMHQLLRALAARDYEEAALCVRQGEEGQPGWPAERFENELEPYYSEYDHIDFTPFARQPDLTRVESKGSNEWQISQVIVDPERENHWFLEGRIELGKGKSTESPLLLLDRIGS